MLFRLFCCFLDSTLWLFCYGILRWIVETSTWHRVVYKILIVVLSMLVLHLCLLVLSIFHEILVHAPICWNLWLLLSPWFRSGISLALSSSIFYAVVWTCWYEIISLAILILVVLSFSRIAAICSLMLLGIWSTLNSVWILLKVSTRHVIGRTIKDHSCALLMSTMTIICSILRRRLLYLSPFDTINDIFYVFRVNSTSLLIMWTCIQTCTHVQLLWIIHFFNLWKIFISSKAFNFE